MKLLPGGSTLSAIRELERKKSMHRQPMSAIRAATAASSSLVEGQLWAVSVGVGAPMKRKCCDRSNGGSEPALPDAAHSMNGGLTARFGSIE